LIGSIPSNICTPTYLAQTAQALAKEFGLDCVVLEESDMSALGMGSLLSSVSKHNMWTYYYRVVVVVVCQ
jgi:leucyl aminopeptidase